MGITFTVLVAAAAETFHLVLFYDNLQIGKTHHLAEFSL